MAVIIEKLRVFSDFRGSVFEPVDGTGLGEFQNAHVVTTLPGAVRGNHYHRVGSETLVAMGPAMIRIREDGIVRDIAVGADEVYRILIPPGVSHAVMNTGDGPNVLVAFNTCAHDPQQPDVIRDILFPIPDPEGGNRMK